MKIFLALLCCVVLSNLIISCENQTESTEPDLNEDYTEIRVTSAGGIFQIDSDFKIAFPAGAVSSDMTLSVARLDEASLEAPFNNYETDQISLLAGFDILPKDQLFSYPVTATFTSLQTASAFIPIIHSVDLDMNIHEIATYSAVVDNAHDSLAISISNTGAYIAEANYSWISMAKPALFGSCRDSLIYVESDEKDVACSFQDCQILESSVLVQFLSCPGQPEETAVLREASPGCVAVLSLTPTASIMATNSSNPINALVKLGCMELEGQDVSFTMTGLGAISPSNAESNEHGIATTVLTSPDEEGTTHIEAEAEVRYPVREIIINGSVIEGFYRTEPVSASTDVTIRELPVYHISLDVTLSNASYCWGGFKDYVNYTAHVEADLPIDTSDFQSTTIVDIMGSQTLGEITFINNAPDTQESVTLKSTDAPASFPCRISAYVAEDGPICFIVIDREDDVRFATWDVLVTYKYNLGSQTVNCWIDAFFEDDNLFNVFEFPKDLQTYSTSGRMTTVLYDGTYTLSVNRAN